MINIFLFEYDKLGDGMRLSDLQSKDIVSVADGKRIGVIIDVSLSNEGRLESLIVSKTKMFNVFNNGEMEIKWNQITKIGEDVILVNMTKVI